jgi:hypothetical protein
LATTPPAGAIVMFRLAGGLLLNLYPRSELAKDAQIPPGPAQSGEFSLCHIVAERTDVDALLAQAEAAGATITDEPHDRPWGIYSGYFRDPDGHVWEVIHNPVRSSSMKTTKCGALYGAPWLQPPATSGKTAALETRSNKPNPWRRT